MMESDMSKLSEQARIDHQVSMLEMEVDNLAKKIAELEEELGQLDTENDLLKEIIKSLAEVL